MSSLGLFDEVPKLISTSLSYFNSEIEKAFKALSVNLEFPVKCIFIVYIFFKLYTLNNKNASSERFVQLCKQTDN